VMPATPAQAWEQAWPESPLPEWATGEPVDEAPYSSSEPESAWNWRSLAASLWLTGVVCVAGTLAFRQRNFWVHFRQVRRSPSVRVTVLLEAAAAAAGLRKCPAIYELDGLAVPALAGLLRPVILLPAGIEGRISPSAIKLILLHECLHVKRVDLWTHFLALTACVLHWWNPVGWWLVRRLHVEREMATDAGVLRRLEENDQRAYGETLLDLARQAPVRAALQPGLGVLESRKILRQRILQIAAFSRVSLAGSVAGLFLLVVLGAALLVREPAPPLEPIPEGAQDREAVVRDFLEKVREGNRSAVERYLDRGLDINSSGPYSNALYTAVSAENLPMVKLLIERGARVNEKTDSGDSPVDRACWLGNKAIADVLIAAGATCDPLVYAAGTGDLAAFEKRGKPLSEAELQKVAKYAAVANHRPVFDWAWEQLTPKWDAAARQKFLNACFFNVATWGQLPMVQRLVELGVDLGKSGTDALGSAVGKNKVAIASYLLSQGVPLVSPSGMPRGLLAEAAGEGCVEMVAMLLDRGAPIDATDESGQTALIWAATMRRDAVCRLLIERGADISIKDKQGVSALSAAAFGGNAPEAVEMLLRRGANPREVDPQGAPILSTMLNFAPPRVGKKGYPGFLYTEKTKREQEARTRRVVEALVRAGADPDAGGSAAPLLAAIRLGHTEAAKTLLELGANPVIADDGGNTPIVFVFEGSWGEGANLKILRMLLDRGADPNATVAKSQILSVPAPMPLLERALILAARLPRSSPAQAGTREAIQLLLARGAKFPGTGGALDADWLAAAACGDLGRLRKLRQAGADLDTVSANGWSALTIAAALGDADTADWLLEQGISAGDAESAYSPLYFAAQTGDEKLVARLLAAGAKPGASVMSAAADSGKASVFEMLAAAGGDASQVSLSSLIRKGNTELLELALKHGADATRNTNMEKRSDVYWAVYYNQPECLRLLLEYGAPPDQQDVYGGTPLEYARQFRPELVPILEAALKRGAS
jgi:ankyrin repeat protein/beta-lactamase regulating signal transducer with metallopeptidase domain